MDFEPEKRMPALVFSLSALIHTTLANPIILPDTYNQDSMEYISFDFLSMENNGTGTISNGTSSDATPSGSDNMAIMWYLVSFGGLLTFFVLLSVSEFCCKRSRLPSPLENARNDEEDPVAPPPYDLFAPPSYESLFRSISDRKRSFRASVYLIPVHEKTELPRESPLEFGEVIRRNPMGDGEVVTPPPPP